MEGNVVLLVDGHGLAYRAFYALPELNTKSGIPTNAVLGFANMLVRIMGDISPRYVGVVFDAAAPTFRHEAFKEYKEGRIPTPETFKEQLPYIKDLVDYLGLKVVIQEGIEADDVIAATALHASRAGYNVIILTADKDIFQILEEGIKIIRPHKGVSAFKEYDKSVFLEEYGFPPSSFPDYLALVGDKVDNIPGVKGIGDKTARSLLKECKNLEGIYDSIDKIKSSISKKLLEYKEQAFASRELVRLRLDNPLKIEELEAQKSKPELIELLDKLEMKKLAERLVRSKLIGESMEPPIKGSESQKTRHGLVSASLRDVLKGKVLCLYWEGEGIYPQKFKVKKACMCSELGEVWRGGSGDFVEIAEFLQKEGQDKTIVLWGYKELCCALDRMREIDDNVWDAKIASYLLHPDKPPVIVDEKLQPEENAMRLLDFYKEASPFIESLGLKKVFRNIEIPLAPVLAKMEKRGLKVEQSILEKLQNELAHRLREINDEIEGIAHTPVNLNSPKQMSWLLFEHLKYPPVKKTKTGYSTDSEVLETLASIKALDNRVPLLALEYRELTKLLSGFIQPLIRSIDNETGSVHTTLEQTSTGTGRLSSRDPNLQNLPMYGKWAEAFRKSLVPHLTRGVFVAGDYSQIELRVLAHLSKEEKLIEAFEKGRDIHSETARWIFGENSNVPTDEQRRLAKMVNFGLLYGMGEYGLAKRLGVGRKEAAELIKRYFDSFPNVKGYLEESAAKAKDEGMTKTLFGRIRPLKEVGTIGGRGGNALERVAINTPIQGTAADIAKLAMIRLDKALRDYGKDVFLVLQIHDSLVCECKEDSLVDVIEILKECMEGVVTLDVPLKVETKTGRSFAEI